MYEFYTRSLLTTYSEYGQIKKGYHYICTYICRFIMTDFLLLLLPMLCFSFIKQSSLDNLHYTDEYNKSLLNNEYLSHCHQLQLPPFCMA